MNTQKSLIILLLLAILVSACSSAGAPEQEVLNEPVAIGKEGDEFYETVDVEMPAAEEPVEESPAEEAADYSRPQPTSTGGAIAQQGFASAEPYNYEFVFEDWLRPVEFQLIHERTGMSREQVAEQLEAQPAKAFAEGPVERVGAILNFTPGPTRDDVLEGKPIRA